MEKGLMTGGGNEERVLKLLAAAINLLRICTVQ